jgi:hypothetical protein
MPGTFQKVNKASRLTFAAAQKCIAHPAEALLLFRMAWWVGFLTAATKCCPLPRALKLVSDSDLIENKKSDVELPNKLARTIDLLLSADIFFLRPICWKRAAVLRRFLAQNGVSTQIIFGVKNEDKGILNGHAWLEVDGQPFLEKTPPDYVVTYTFPSEQNREPQFVP